MLPKAWCGGTLALPVIDKTFINDVVGKDSRLLGAINAAANFEVDLTIVRMFVKVVFIDEFLREFSEIDADIFGAVQWSLEVEVSDIEGGVFFALA